ncbi:hypothetical protein D3H65_00890 [Paraflavitalea soli]|uniref:Uncharacterized protein n=1 Tax=Paraflavitalea soli TaxID=2315862 RepID=A0A3B7ME63_9BACT|nr:hypothetical protein [Paraflavitalea soli]AXY72614.1 hypothetical protein D3H65_00890 [Paraflavitalea soli]
MRIILPILLLCSTLALAQDDEFRDFRNKKDNFSKMQQKDIRAELASFLMAGIDESITKLPLKSVPVKSYGSNYMTWANDQIQVTIKTGIFDPSKHKIMLEEKHVVKVDGKPYYGNYGEMPRVTIESITVMMGKDTVVIPPSAYFDLYEPSFFYQDKDGSSKTRNGVFISNDGRSYYIYLLNTAYKGNEYTWVIQDKKYLRRVVDFDVLK